MKALAVLGTLLLVVALWAVGVWALFVCWNAVATYFGFQLITFWVAACILAVVRILKGVPK